MLQLLAVSCDKQGADDGMGRSEPCSLTLSVGLPSISADTKANCMYPDADNYGKIITKPFGTSLEGWTDTEKLIDARVMYRLTLLLVDEESKTLVGYRDLYKDSPDMTAASSDYGANGWIDENGDFSTTAQFGTHAVVTFNYDHPLHHAKDGTSTESLSRGPFRIIAVANYSETSFSTDSDAFGVFSYSGLTDKEGNRFTDYIESIISQFNALETASDAGKFGDYDNYRKMMDFVMFADNNDFLCELTVQPMSLVHDFELQPGKNSVSGLLKRCWARVRVTVENVSKSELTVNAVTFSKTARDQSYLFVAPGNEPTSLTDPEGTNYGAPTMLIGDKDAGKPYNALISVVKKTKIPGWTTSSDNGSLILFDGYILDTNGQGNPFTYHLEFEYENKLITLLERAKTADGEWDVNKGDISTVFRDGEEEDLYVIQNQNREKRILLDGTSQMETEFVAVEYRDSHNNFTDNLKVFTPEQVFRIVRATDPETGKDTKSIVSMKDGESKEYPLAKIQTYDRLYWLGTPERDANIKLMPRESDATIYVVRDDGNHSSHPDLTYLSFWSTKANKQGINDFMNIYYGQQDQLRGWNENDAGSQFYLHRVVKTAEKAKYDGDVTLTTIDPVTAVPTRVKAIHRNDFINIYVTVSYNDKTGNFNFEVKDWSSIDSSDDITFN